jgi:hypothetical protein
VSGFRRTNTSAEERCLRLLARGKLTPDVAAEARALLGQTLSWSLILNRVRWHGVFPLLARNLEALQFHGVPAEAKAELENACRKNAAWNALLARELTRVLGTFDRAGVPAVPLKGLVLADRLYGDITLRVCSDIDLLIRRDAAGAAVAALRTEGYRPDGERWASAGEEELFLASDIEAAFRRSDHPAAPLIDLHWDITRRWRTDTKPIDDLWVEASPTTWRGVKAYRLSPEWELLYLAVHAVRHRWQALKWLVDIHDACAVLDVDWDRLAAKADGLGWGRALRLTLGLCRTLLGTAVPEGLASPPPRWALAQACGVPGVWRNAVIPARVLDRRGDRLRYVLRLLLQPTILERRAVRLPAALAVAYYLLRPLRLTARWAGPIAASALEPWRYR